MSNLQRLLLVALSSLTLIACVKKEYVVMQGASPSIPREQALANCESQAEQIARQQYQQELADYNQRLQKYEQQFTAMTPTNNSMDCRATGFNRFSCDSTSYNNTGMAMLNAQVAAGSQPIYLGARNYDIERCMRGMGFVAVEVK